MAEAFANPPTSPRECLFSRMSVNYSADLKTFVEPCVFGGTPDCSQCGCSISAGLHWLGQLKFGPLKVAQLVRASMAVGKFISKFRVNSVEGVRWKSSSQHGDGKLVQIQKGPFSNGVQRQS